MGLCYRGACLRWAVLHGGASQVAMHGDVSRQWCLSWGCTTGGAAGDEPVCHGPTRCRSSFTMPPVLFAIILPAAVTSGDGSRNLGVHTVTQPSSFGLPMYIRKLMQANKLSVSQTYTICCIIATSSWLEPRHQVHHSYRNGYYSFLYECSHSLTRFSSRSLFHSHYQLGTTWN